MKRTLSPVCFFALCFMSIYTPAKADVVAEIVVVGRQLENALSDGDYYNIGRLYGELMRLEYQMEIARHTGQGSSGSSQTDSQLAINRCVADTHVERNKCRLDAQTTFQQGISSCLSGFNFSLPWVGSLAYDTGQYQRCMSQFGAIRDKHTAVCDLNQSTGERLCYR